MVAPRAAHLDISSVCGVLDFRGGTPMQLGTGHRWILAGAWSLGDFRIQAAHRGIASWPPAPGACQQALLDHS